MARWCGGWRRLERVAMHTWWALGTVTGERLLEVVGDLKCHRESTNQPGKHVMRAF